MLLIDLDDEEGMLQSPAMTRVLAASPTYNNSKNNNNMNASGGSGGGGNAAGGGSGVGKVTFAAQAAVIAKLVYQSEQHAPAHTIANIWMKSLF